MQRTYDEESGMRSNPTITAEATTHGVQIGSPEWGELAFGPLVSKVALDGTEHVLRAERGRSAGSFSLRMVAPDAPCVVVQEWRRIEAGWHVACRMEVLGTEPHTLNSVELLALAPGMSLTFGPSATRLVMLEQGQYWGHVIPLFPVEGEVESASSLVWLMADATSGEAFLVGYETARRFNGRVRTRRRGPRTLDGWSLGFDGGDLLIEPGEAVELEDLLLLAGDDPLDLLDRYGERVRDRHEPEILSEPPVSWCSWYPYRLGVSHGRVIANARIGAQRLKPLGLSVIEVDLGWQEGYLPSLFEENDQFPSALRGLAAELDGLGFRMGVWAGPTSISEHDPLVREHPEWLVRNPDGTIHDSGQWFWEPHGAVHILDLTHPGAQAWLRDRIRSVAERGARYLKADFVGNLGSGAAKVRYNRKIVAGGGLETGHLAIQIMRGAMADVASDCLFLDCGGPELPGPSTAGLVYTCDDTGNTGYVGWHHLKKVFLATATHLFKNRRWGIIQPSCLCVGLPGTLAEARARATMAFMAGGQIDVSDDLTTLPEDRWKVLTATLPPYGVSARPIDLFEPVRRTSGGYSTQGTDVPQSELPGAPPASVWVLPVKATWDDWRLAAVFNLDEPEQKGERRESQLQTYLLPVERLGLLPEDDLWAYEFWSGQFCGCLPADPPPPPNYVHPGDQQMPVRRTDPDTVVVSFFGPGVVLLALRPRRAHPWVVGTSFHQSCGHELQDVSWDGRSSRLSGRLVRPAGEDGFIVVSGLRGRSVVARVDGQPVPVRSGAQGSTVIPIIVRSGETPWEVYET